MHEHCTDRLKVVLELGSAVGSAREINEDGVVLCPDTGSCAVIDGGGARGDLATLRIQRAYAGLLAEQLAQPDAEPEKALVHTLEGLSEALMAANTREPHQGSGAAVTALLIHEDHAHIAHCGDTRAYLLRGDEVTQLTVDDTLVAELIARGELEPAEAATHPYSTIVTQVLGFSTEIQVRAYEQRLEPGDLILLCSDGLWRAVPSEELETLLVQRPAALLHRLIDRAVELGTDNVAVVLVHISEP